MKTASSAQPNQVTRNKSLFEEHNADPAPRTGILQDPSNGEFTRDSEDDSACESMLEINEAYKRIGDVMTSLQERSLDSVMTSAEQDELVLDLSRSLWNLNMARHYVGKIGKENNLSNLASAPRSTEITLSHGHATTNEEEIKGTMVPVFKKVKGLWFREPK